jgi:hypothetical protein
VACAGRWTPPRANPLDHRLPWSVIPCGFSVFVCRAWWGLPLLPLHLCLVGASACCSHANTANAFEHDVVKQDGRPLSVLASVGDESGDLWATNAVCLLVSWMAASSAERASSPPFLSEPMLQEQLAVVCPSVATPSLDLAVALKRVLSLPGVPGTHLLPGGPPMPALFTLLRCSNPDCGLASFCTPLYSPPTPLSLCTRCKAPTTSVGVVKFPMETLLAYV